jgi:hypothetical protein
LQVNFGPLDAFPVKFCFSALNRINTGFLKIAEGSGSEKSPDEPGRIEFTPVHAGAATAFLFPGEPGAED